MSNIKRYNGTSWETIPIMADKATADASGNNISTTYAKKADVYTKTETDSKLSAKQDKLVSGTNIKTINTSNTAAQTVSANEAIAGSGTINLHKVAKTGSYNDLNNKPTNLVTTNTNQTVTGTKNFSAITVTTIGTGSDANNYFQSQKFRGEGDANTYYHAIDFGFANHNHVDFYEYGGLWNFWKNTEASATTADDNLCLQIGNTYVKNKGNTFTWPTTSGTLALKEEIPTALKNPNALKFGSKTYDGSSAQTITLTDLGGQAAGNYALKNEIIAKSVLTTKGDMIYASAASTPARLGIGSNGQFLSVANGIPAWVNNPNTDTNSSHSHSAGVGLVGSGSAGTSGTYTYKAKLRSETALTVDSAAATTLGRVYPVAVDKSGYLSLNVPPAGFEDILKGIKGRTQVEWNALNAGEYGSNSTYNGATLPPVISEHTSGFWNSAAGRPLDISFHFAKKERITTLQVKCPSYGGVNPTMTVYYAQKGDAGLTLYKEIATISTADRKAYEFNEEGISADYWVVRFTSSSWIDLRLCSPNGLFTTGLYTEECHQQIMDRFNDYQPVGNYALKNEIIAKAADSLKLDGHPSSYYLNTDSALLKSGSQTATSTADDGSNVYTFTDTTGKTSTFTVKNGSKGSTGAHISSVTGDKTPAAGNTVTYTMKNSDGTTAGSFKVVNGTNGANGTNGSNGASAGFGTIAASIDNGVGTPSVTVTASGSNTAKNFDFAFKNLKGDKGDTGSPVNISLNGSTYTQSDGTITLPGLVTTGTEQTVSAKKNFTNTIEVKGAEINAETRIGTYPRVIESTGILDVDLIVEEWIAGNEVDFKNHKISSGAYLYFEYPELLEHYGLNGDDGTSSVPYSNYALNKDIPIPETTTTEAQLKAYVKSSAFASEVDSAGYTIDECIMLNNVAVYSSDIQDISFNGTNIIVNDILDCLEGEGKQIVGASDPIIAHVLKTKNLKVENLEVENSLIGTEGNHVAKAIYVHKISWKYVSNSPNVYLSYLSTKPTPYSSKADIFSHQNETSLRTSEIVEYGDQSAIVKFRPTGAVLNALAIGATSQGGVNTFAMDPNAFDFVKDEVISSWGV